LTESRPSPRIPSCLPGRIFFPLLALWVLLSAAVAHASAALEPPAWRTGTLEEGDVVSLVLKVVNRGERPLRLERVFHSCDCLEADYSPALIEPGRFAPVRLKLTAFDLPERFEEFLYVETDDPDRPIMRFSITGVLRGGGRGKVYPKLPEGKGGKALVIHFFFSPSCSGCDELRAGPFARVLRDFGDRVAVVEHDVSDTSDNFFNYRLLRAYEERFGVRRSEPVEVFFGDTALVGRKRVKDELYDAVRRALERDAGGPRAVPAGAAESVRGLSLAGALVMGLLDGLNPCVFAGLVFFLSYLLAVGLRGRVLLQVGLVYSLAVFLTYFAAGLALFAFFYEAGTFPLLSRALGLLSALLALGGGAMSLRDAAVAASGRTERLWLKLPDRLRDFMHAAVRRRKERFALFGATFGLGVLVTFVEGACTGLQYLPACRMMLKVGEDLGARLFALLLLAAYNAAFILPLLALLALVLAGARFTRARTLQARQAALGRLLAGLGLLALGGVLLWWELA